MKPSTRSTQSASPPTSWTARLRGREREGGREGGGLITDTVASISLTIYTCRRDLIVRFTYQDTMHLTVLERREKSRPWRKVCSGKILLVAVWQDLYMGVPI